MTRHSVPFAAAIPALLIEALRCRNNARDTGLEELPCLSRTLAARDCTILAPVFHSLFHFCEAALGRPLAAGGALAISEDEHLLLGLLDGSRPRRCLACDAEAGTALDCALCSTRVMLSLALQ